MPAPSVSSPVKALAASTPSPEKAVTRVKAVLTEAPQPQTFVLGVSRAPCAPFLAGKCQRGETCHYNHDRDQIFGGSALDEPSPQVAVSKSKNKRQFNETKDSENVSPNKAKKNDSADKDQGSSPVKRARLSPAPGVEETKQIVDHQDGQEGQYWEFYEDDGSGYWDDSEEYGLYDYGYGYDEPWDGSYGEYFECWAEEEY